MKARQRILTVLSLFFVCLSTAMAPTAHAQEADEGPPRQAERQAPQRAYLAWQEPGPRGVAQTVVELPAAADAYIASARPDENFGSAALYVGYHNAGEDRFGAQRSLLRFDLSGIPAGVAVLEARLRLYMSFATPSDSDDMRIIARQLTSAWDERFVTWNTEPMWGDVRSETFVGSDEGWYDWELTDLVSDWISDSALNHGMELIGDERVQQRERAFNSRETQSDLYPRLVVRYTEQEDNQPPSVAVNPLPQFSPRNFTVSWAGSDPGGAGIAHYDVQFQVDGGDWIDWQMGTTATNADFTGGQSGRTYGFRARGVDNAGNIEPFGEAEASTTVNVNAPTTQVDPLPSITTTPSFTVSWSGSDIGSGIAHYDVRYRINDGGWALWQQQTIATSAVFTTQADGLYEFEARAVDRAGLVEPFIGAVEAWTVVDARAPHVVPQAWLPLAANGSTPTLR
jgi:hypothetical protein